MRTKSLKSRGRSTVVTSTNKSATRRVISTTTSSTTPIDCRTFPFLHVVAYGPEALAGGDKPGAFPNRKD